MQKVLVDFLNFHQRKHLVIYPLPNIIQCSEDLDKPKSLIVIRIPLFFTYGLTFREIY